MLWSSNMTSRSMNMTSRNNGRYLNLRHNWSSNRSMYMTCSNVPARRTMWMRWRVNILRTRDRGWMDLSNYVHVIPYSHLSQIWYPNRITNPRPSRNMWCSFHCRDGRCNVTCAPKPLHMVRNESAPRHSVRLKLRLDLTWNAKSCVGKPDIP